MSSITEDDPLVRSLRIADVTAYLSRSGWRPIESRRSGLLAFERELAGASRPLQVALTRDPSYPDTYRRIAEVVTTLSELEDKPAYEVARSIATVDTDVMLWSVPETQTAGASISLALAASWIEHLRDLVAYAACAERDPRPYFAKQTAIGAEYVKQCRFGHTVPGSFAFQIESPVPPRLQLAFDPELEVPPFERRVVQRIMRATAAVRSSVLTGDPASLANDYRLGLNANLSETLEQMLADTGESGLTVQPRWSPAWPVPQEFRDMGPVRLEYRAAQFLEAAARELRQPERGPERTIVGRITQLRSEAELDVDDADIEDTLHDDSSTVTLAPQNEGLRGLLVRVSLPVPEYKQACDAHRDGREVEVRGHLEKIGKFWTLTNGHGFRVLGAGDGAVAA